MPASSPTSFDGNIMALRTTHGSATTNVDATIWSLYGRENIGLLFCALKYHVASTINFVFSRRSWAQCGWLWTLAILLLLILCFISVLFILFICCVLLVLPFFFLSCVYQCLVFHILNDIQFSFFLLCLVICFWLLNKFFVDKIENKQKRDLSRKNKICYHLYVVLQRTSFLRFDSV